MRHHRVIIAAGLLALGSAGCGDSGSGGGGAIQLGSTGDADEGPGGSGVDGHSGGVDAGGAGPSGDAGGGGGATDTVGGDGTGGGGHLGVLDLLEPETWCSRVAAGPAGERAGLLGLADAFVELRQFGVMSMPDALDEALRKALVTAQGDPELALAHLAANRAGVCSFSAATRALGAASVSLDAGVATVKPGTGEVTLPAGAEVVILDLRDLPAVPELRAVLGAALAPALASTDAGSARRVRRFEGLPGSFDNSSLKTLQVFLTAEWAATGAADLPIVILMGAALAPEVAELAIHLRRTGRAWLVGPGPVPAWVAESRWAPAGAAGIVYRYAVGASTTVWPDEVAVDFPVAALADAVQAARGGAPSVPEAAPATRPAMTTWAYANTPAAAQPGVQSHVAALVAFHGLVRRFFPYLGEVDSAALDERLLDLVSDQLATPSANIGEAQLWMRSYTHLLHDGFAGVFHEDPAWQTYRYRLGLVVDHDDAGLPLIVRSDNEHFAPGERVTQLDGVPVADWYDTHEHLGSWSADAARLAELSWFWRVGHGLARVNRG